MGLGEEKAHLGDEIVHEQVINVFLYVYYYSRFKIFTKLQHTATNTFADCLGKQPAILYKLKLRLKFMLNTEQQTLHNLLVVL